MISFGVMLLALTAVLFGAAVRVFLELKRLLMAVSRGETGQEHLADIERRLDRTTVLTYATPVALFLSMLLLTLSMRHVPFVDSNIHLMKWLGVFVPLFLGVAMLAAAQNIQSHVEALKNGEGARSGLRRWILSVKVLLVVGGIPLACLMAIQLARDAGAGAITLIGLLGGVLLLYQLAVPRLLARLLPTAAIRDPGLVEAIRRLAESASMRLEDIRVLSEADEAGPEGDAPVAVATGVGQSKRIFVGADLIDRYSADVALAVIAHEIAHHEHAHLLKLVLLHLAWIGSVTILANTEFIPSDVAVALLAMLFVCGPLFLRWYGRRAELRADRTAAERTSPEALIEFLQSLSEARKRSPARSRSRLHTWLAALWSTHPPIDVRIRALRKVVSRAEGRSVSSLD